MDLTTLTRNLKAEAQRLGFDHCRILPVTHAPHADFFDAWVDAGRPGEMHYLARHQEKRRDPTLLADRKHGPFATLVVLAVNYHQFALPPDWRDDPSRGIIASYAWGDDYHEIIRPLLYELDAFIRGQTGRATQGKCLVDTGPVLERDWAARAGIGFTGKNCCIIHPRDGSWLLLATLLIPETLIYDPVVEFAHAPSPAAVINGLPRAANYGRVMIPLAHGTIIPRQPIDPANTDTVAYQADEYAPGTCGQCTRCLDACPTNAFIGPYHLDPQRCISYWTIETQTPIPRPLRHRFGNRIFGCDICQEVCPWNQRLAERRPLMQNLLANQDHIAPPLLEGFARATPYWLDDNTFAERFVNSPILRAKRIGMARNVAIALGNWRSTKALGALQQLLSDPSSLVRGHAAWALGEFLRAGDVEGQATIQHTLNHAASQETDAWAQAEIALAIAGNADYATST